MKQQVHVCYRIFCVLAASAFISCVIVVGASEDVPVPARQVELFVSKSTAMKLATIPAGEFEMGSHDSKDELSEMFAKWGAEAKDFDDEFPLHKVKIARSFQIGVTEVTQHEYQAITGTNPSQYSSSGRSSSKVTGMDTGSFPVENVSWFDAVAFCNKMSEKDGLKPYYRLTEIERDTSIIRANVDVLGGSGYRLPTEAEWEFACRAGTKTTFNLGRDVASLERAGWYGAFARPRGNSQPRSNRVGQKGSNEFGLYDMHGNVGEWCFDSYEERAYSSRANIAVGPEDTGKRELCVFRGGTWAVPPSSSRSSARRASAPNGLGGDIGFRVARTP